MHGRRVARLTQGWRLRRLNARSGFLDPGNPGYGLCELLPRFFFDEMWSNDQYLLGVAHALANDRLAFPSNASEDWSIKEYNLFGDPELPMWLSQPLPLQVAHTTEIGGTSTVSVHVASSGVPVEGARVCLQKGDWKYGDVYQVGSTGASGDCQFFVQPSSTGTITLTVWAREHIPWQGSIEVTGTGTEVFGPVSREDLILSSGPCPAATVFDVRILTEVPGSATMAVYDAAGRMVRSLETAELTPGLHDLTWDLRDHLGRRVPSGIYPIVVSFGDRTAGVGLVVCSD